MLVTYSMKLAIPIFGPRISPRFDCARQILVLELKGKEIVSREQLDKRDWLPYSDAVSMKSMGVNTVICGGIRHWDLFSLNGQGIKVIYHVFGEVDDVIDRFLKGNLKSCCLPKPIRRNCRREDL